MFLIFAQFEFPKFVADVIDHSLCFAIRTLRAQFALLE